MHLKENNNQLPKDARMVFFDWNYDPCSPVIKHRCPWIEQHYR